MGIIFKSATCRKTICFSKNEEVRDKLIGIYIEKHYFKTGKYY
ncbi:MAG: IS1 family transposase [Prevotellaceae bacterium]|nr:IS1 family transposase [Prevotellaceae bacterium]